MTFIDDAALDGLRSIARSVGALDVLDDRFEIREPLGQGAMGSVFSAWDRSADTLVAVKLLREARDEPRFAHEVGALERIDHPGVARYVAHGTHAGHPYVAMELIAGESLAKVLDGGALPQDEVVALATTLGGALSTIHAEGLIHRDIKPSNIVLREKSLGSACLIDFGLARDRKRQRITATGALVGTPGYMAPEQVRGESELSAAVDVFALGCVLVECLTGAPAFSADDDDGLFAKILLESPPLPAAIPAGLRSILNKLLDKDATRRPIASEVAHMFDALDLTAPARVSQFAVRAGDVIADKYEVVRELGSGGMGLVLLAKHCELGTPVALKILKSENERVDKTEAARFLREAQAAARLESAHAVRVLDVGRIPDGPPFIVMERLRGRDLAVLLREEGALPVDRAVGIVLEACEAIAEAHALGIVHRDIKPSNLFSTERRDGTPLIKVLDFGISKVTQPFDAESMSITSPTAVMGSAAYMSPEQLRASRTVDTRTDIWSLGVVLYELISGRAAFDAHTPAAIGALIATEEPPPLVGVPEGLRDVVDRCLGKDVASRFPDVADLADALVPFGPVGCQRRAARIRHILTHTGDTVDGPAGHGRHATSKAWDASPDDGPAPRAWRKWGVVGAALVVVGALITLGRSTSDPVTTSNQPSDAEQNRVSAAATTSTVATPSNTPSSVVAPRTVETTIAPQGDAPRGTSNPSAPSVHTADAAQTTAPRSAQPKPHTPKPRPPKTAQPKTAQPQPKQPTPGPARSRDVDLLDPALSER